MKHLHTLLFAALMAIFMGCVFNYNRTSVPKTEEVAYCSNILAKKTYRGNNYDVFYVVLDNKRIVVLPKDKWDICQVGSYACYKNSKITIYVTI